MNQFCRKEKSWITSAHRGFVQAGVAENTLAAYRLAAAKGADMIELDARKTRDGVLVVNHDPTVKGFDAHGAAVEYAVADTDWAQLVQVKLLPQGDQACHIPTLSEALHLVYFAGMCVNIDLKEGHAHAAEVAHMVVAHGLRGRTVYATNGAGAETIRTILQIDPEARFIDTKANFTRAALKDIPDYPARCFVYTKDFSDENIAEIRQSGCMLAAISLNAETVQAAFAHHPDMAEYPHTSDFEALDQAVLAYFA